MPRTPERDEDRALYWTPEWAAYYGIQPRDMNDLRPEEIESMRKDIPIRRQIDKALLALAQAVSQDG